MKVYDYTTAKYKDDTVKCPACKRKAIISRVASLQRTVYIHVQEEDAAGIFYVKDYCIKKDEDDTTRRTQAGGETL